MFSYEKLLSELTPSIILYTIIFTEFKEVDGCSSKSVYMYIHPLMFVDLNLSIVS